MRELQFGAGSFWAARRINKSFRNEHEALEIRGLAWTGVGGCGRDVSAHLRCGHPHRVVLKVMMRYRVVSSQWCILISKCQYLTQPFDTVPNLYLHH